MKKDHAYLTLTLSVFGVLKLFLLKKSLFSLQQATSSSFNLSRRHEYVQKHQKSKHNESYTKIALIL